MPDSAILGIGNLRDNFAQINEAAIQTRIGRRMVAVAGAVVKKEAKSLAQQQGLRRTGALIKNIVIKRETKAPSGTVQYNLGVRHGRNLTRKQKKQTSLAVSKGGRIYTRYDNDPWYWKFAEFGTKRKDGSVRQQATPFIGPALENSASTAITAMGDALTAELKKAGLT